MIYIDIRGVERKCIYRKSSFLMQLYKRKQGCRSKIKWVDPLLRHLIINRKYKAIVYGQQVLH